MSQKDILSIIKKEDVAFVDLRFTDTLGRERHISVPSHTINEELFTEGRVFDGSSVKGWQKIQSSDMLLIPDEESFFMDPFFKEKTLAIRCTVLDPVTKKGYNRDPRNIARRAESYLNETGIADKVYFGPEPEFFLFDDVRFRVSHEESSVVIDSREGCWNSKTEYEFGNHGHRPGLKGGYCPAAPVDSSQNIRSEISKLLEQMGIEVEAHHHEVATGNQNEISTRFNSLLKKADELQTMKYVIRNVAHQHGLTATFMPKPLWGDNGSGMHCHQSLAKDGINLFAGDVYAGLSETALFYIGGILKHARALNAFTNPSTNSYRRLIPGFEAPVILGYSARNRSAAIRIPHCASELGRRIEARFPDAVSNPYTAFAAMLMAGLDGIQKKIHPGEAMDYDAYEVAANNPERLSYLCSSLNEALDALTEDHDFLTAGGVFDKSALETYIAIKREELNFVASVPHPAEFELYYSF